MIAEAGCLSYEVACSAERFALHATGKATFPDHTVERSAERRGEVCTYVCVSVEGGMYVCMYVVAYKGDRRLLASDFPLFLFPLFPPGELSVLPKTRYWNPEKIS